MCRLLLPSQLECPAAQSQLHVDDGAYMYLAPPCSLGVVTLGIVSQPVGEGAPSSRSAQRLRQL